MSEALKSADVCLPFILAGGAFRGRLVRLTAAATEIIKAHQDPEPVSLLLAEAMAAAVALASGLKYKGVFTLQVQGKGPVHTLVTDVTSDGALRGCTKFDPGEVAAEMARARTGAALPHLLGPGAHLSFTVDQGQDTERYQGIVELSGETLADAIHHYFRQSEQLESALKIVASAPQDGAGDWVAAALLLQRMPEAGGVPIASREESDDVWRTAVILMSSVKDAELLDVTLTPERLLHRLFATLDVRAAKARPVAAKCRCSRARSERILASFPVEEVKSYADNGEIHMTCEFCRADYVFLESDIEAIAEKHRA
ncbi:MAG: Hsp33 family molecular chaperone HslO [Rhodospirillaceae bacterium]|nr:Hsp33 family molecular chaperone HslO [Rhodospirillaceae bacterium]